MEVLHDVSALSWSLGAGMFVFYVLGNTALQCVFYARSAAAADSNLPASKAFQKAAPPKQMSSASLSKWKLQPQENADHLGDRRCWLPLFQPWTRKSRRHPAHCIFATVNIALASLMVVTLAELIRRGKSRMYFEPRTWGQYFDAEVPIHGGSQAMAWGNILSVWIVEASIAMLYQSVAEYYWHVMMHLKFCYRTMHKYHHYYKAPEPFDDLMIHPLEAFGYYTILYSPPLLFSMNWISFLMYMTVCGITGITDHSGIRFEFKVFGKPFYSTMDHDKHHSLVTVNYGFPFPFMDVLHDTLEGQWMWWKGAAASGKKLS